jgi:hypothetical protein
MDGDVTIRLILIDSHPLNCRQRSADIVIRSRGAKLFETYFRGHAMYTASNVPKDNNPMSNVRGVFIS